MRIAAYVRTSAAASSSRPSSTAMPGPPECWSNAVRISSASDACSSTSSYAFVKTPRSSPSFENDESVSRSGL